MYGVDYASPGHGLLSICANQGITFDLDAIRQANPNCKIVRFVAVAANTEIRSEQGLTASADVWVFVDGQVRKKVREIGAGNGAIPINIAISARDRFLTLATTDAENSIDCDWVMFGDPRLEMVEMEDVDK